MDVTPTKNMFAAMTRLADAFIGEEPEEKDKSSGAVKRRIARRKMMDVLHSLVALSMREGAARAFDPQRTALSREMFGFDKPTTIPTRNKLPH